MQSPLSETASPRLLRIMLELRGWPHERLVLELGETSVNVTKAFSDPALAKVRRRIENLVGLAIWSNQADFEQRRAEIALIGVDPGVLNRHELAALARERGMKAHYMNGRKRLIALLREKEQVTRKAVSAMGMEET